MWVFPPIVIVIGIIYMTSYILLRTAGDGRPALERLVHPGRGGLQEEYGGDGHGHPHAGYGPPASLQDGTLEVTTDATGAPKP
jgi:hypothetical protein